MAARKEGSRRHRRSFGSARQQLKAHGHGSNPQEDGGRTEAAVGEAEERVIKEPAKANTRASRSGSKDRLMDYGIDMLQRQMDTQFAEPVNNTFRSVHRRRGQFRASREKSRVPALLHLCPRNRRLVQTAAHFW